MAVKDEVLRLLEVHRGSYVSGTDMAEEIGVSRVAVNKAVDSLRKRGYGIQAAPNKGYLLAEDTDMLSTAAIDGYLGDAADLFSVETYSSVGSTNDEVRQWAQQGAPAWSVAVAAEQTQGRGRRGRSFYSPGKTGLYLSILLRPHLPVERASFITASAAVAVARAIEEESGGSASIKWVNDVFVDGRKVCGILTEGGVSMEDGSLDTAVVGIGINLYRPEGGFPEDIANVAGAVFDAPCVDMRNRLAASILKGFYGLSLQMGGPEMLEEYRNRSSVVGRQIDVVRDDRRQAAMALAIDDDLRLLVRYDDGAEEALQTGEVSIRCR